MYLGELFFMFFTFFFPFGLGRPSASQDATQFTLMLLHAQRWRRTAHWGSLVRYMVDLDFSDFVRFAIYGKQTLRACRESFRIKYQNDLFLLFEKEEEENQKKKVFQRKQRSCVHLEHRRCEAVMINCLGLVTYVRTYCTIRGTSKITAFVFAGV